MCILRFGRDNNGAVAATWRAISLKKENNSKNKHKVNATKYSSAVGKGALRANLAAHTPNIVFAQMQTPFATEETKSPTPYLGGQRLK